MVGLAGDAFQKNAFALLPEGNFSPTKGLHELVKQAASFSPLRSEEKRVQVFTENGPIRTNAVRSWIPSTQPTSARRLSTTPPVRRTRQTRLTFGGGIQRRRAARLPN